MTDEPEVLLAVDSYGVAVITLNRPERRNAWSPALEQSFYAVLKQADRDPAVKVAVMTGAGKSFCPGVDSEQLDRVADSGVDFTGRLPFSQTLAFRKPLIAAINGGCAGAGFAQAMMCDVRFIAASARMSTSFARRGLPAEHGLSWLLPRIVGNERALDLLLSARVVTADEALRLGLVSRVVESDQLMTEALAYARDIALNCGPAAMALIKHQLIVDRDASYADALDRAYRVTVAASRGPEFRKGIDSLLEKRPPSFDGLAADYSPADILGVPLPGQSVDPGAA